MSTEQQMTLEQIEAHIKQANIGQYDQAMQMHVSGKAALQPAAVLTNVCGVYKAIKPVLTVIVNFPLLPGAIKTAIRTFMSVMNSLCP